MNPEAGYFIAVDLERARIRYALTNLVGDIRYRWEQELGIRSRARGFRLLRGLQMVQRNLASWQHSRWLAMGISCPGFIHQNGLVTAVNLGWRKFPLSEKWKEATSLPFFLCMACRTYILANAGWAGLKDAIIASTSKPGRASARASWPGQVAGGSRSNGRRIGPHDHRAGRNGSV